MTPIARAVLDLATRDKSAWVGSSYKNALGQFPDVHCFDLSQVTQLSQAMAMQCEKRQSISETLAFLPAPATWIEWCDERLSGEVPGYKGSGYLLTQKSDTAASVFEFAWINGFFGATHPDIPLLRTADPEQWAVDAAADWGESMSPNPTRDLLNVGRSWAYDIYTKLALINSPRVIGRRQRMVHAGLQRKIAAAKGMVGRFPLQAWTEIILEVTPPRVDESTEHETRLTGGKALHFCRSHLRIRLGRLELVSAHWRGDSSLGIKQSRYSVVPPKARRDGEP